MPGARSAFALLLAINLFNYIDRQVLAAVEPEIAKFGGKVLHTSLSKEAEARLQAALDAGAAGTPPPVAPVAS